jgi:hypothetical protein
MAGHIFYKLALKNSTTHFLLLAFMVSWMAAVPTQYIHFKKWRKRVR